MPESGRKLRLRARGWGPGRPGLHPPLQPNDKTLAQTLLAVTSRPSALSQTSPPSPAAHHAQHPDTKALSRALSPAAAGAQPSLSPSGPAQPWPWSSQPCVPVRPGTVGGRGPGQAGCPQARNGADTGHAELKQVRSWPGADPTAVLPANESPSSWGEGRWLPWRTSWAWGWGTAESGPGKACARRFSRWPSRGSLWHSTSMLSGTRTERVSPAELPVAHRPCPGHPAGRPDSPRREPGPSPPAGARTPWPGPSPARPHTASRTTRTPQRPLPGSLRPPPATSAPTGPCRGLALCQAPEMQRCPGGCLSLGHAQVQNRTAEACLVRAWGSWGPLGLAGGEADGREAEPLPEARVGAWRRHVGTQATGGPQAIPGGRPAPGA